MNFYNHFNYENVNHGAKKIVTEKRYYKEKKGSSKTKRDEK